MFCKKATENIPPHPSWMR